MVNDCWELPDREKGHLKADPAAFTEGIKGLADYVHSKGLKMGIYSDWGKATCQNKAGSYGYEAADAVDFADCDLVDYALKYDNCNIPSLSEQEKSYQKMRDALTASGRPIVFSICTWEFKDWMPETGNLWRTGGDIHDDWGSMVGAIDNNEQRSAYSHPGAWNDPDMLEVGNGGMNCRPESTGPTSLMGHAVAAPPDCRKRCAEHDEGNQGYFIESGCHRGGPGPLGIAGCEGFG